VAVERLAVVLAVVAEQRPAALDLGRALGARIGK
jgi:hypothetical protein